MDVKPLLLWSDALVFLLVVSLVLFFYRLRRDPQTRERWGQVFSSRLGMVTFTVILTYVAIALLDSLHSWTILDAMYSGTNKNMSHFKRIAPLAITLMLTSCAKPPSVEPPTKSVSLTAERRLAATTLASELAKPYRSREGYSGRTVMKLTYTFEDGTQESTTTTFRTHYAPPGKIHLTVQA